MAIFIMFRTYLLLKIEGIFINNDNNLDSTIKNNEERQL